FLSLYDRTKDGRYDAQFKRVWYANNIGTIPRDSTGALKFQLGDTAVYVSTTNDDTVPRRYRVYTPKTYSSRIFPSLNKFEDPFRLAVNDTRGSRDYLLFRLAETYLIAAEALMRDGRPAEGLPYINAVRRRAAIPGHEAEMELTVGQLTLDEVLNERARELAGETMRWFDLVRPLTPSPSGRGGTRARLYSSAWRATPCATFRGTKPSPWCRHWARATSISNPCTCRSSCPPPSWRRRARRSRRPAS